MKALQGGGGGMKLKRMHRVDCCVGIKKKMLKIYFDINVCTGNSICAD